MIVVSQLVKRARQIFDDSLPQAGLECEAKMLPLSYACLVKNTAVKGGIDYQCTTEVDGF